jgi:hypothetical protein
MSDEQPKVQTLIRIGSEDRDADDLDMTAADRKFRDAWTFEGDAVVLDPQKMKPRAQQLVNEWRDAEKHKPITIPAGTFSADEASVANVDRALQGATIIEAGGQPFSVEWSDHENNAVVLDKTALAQLGLAIMGRTDQLYRSARAKKAAIDEATTVAEIKAILAEIGK